MKKILVLIFTFIICGCGYDKYAIPEGAYITIDETPIETYNELNLYDLIEDTNVEITTDNNSLDTTKLGKNTITIDYVYEKSDYKFDISYEVVDTTPPTFISASSVRTIIKNNDAYFCDNIVYADDYDKHPTCRIEGEYDLTTTGVYNVQYILEDQSGNTKSKNLKINVVDEISSSGGSSLSSNQNHLEFSDAISKYKTDTTEIGIDVSRWQGEIDWQKVKDAGVEFVIMRIGVQSDYDKEISVDSYYYQNIQGAKDVGLKVGVYVYTTAINKEMAIDHAKWVLEILDGTELDFPIAYDWENWNKFMNYEINLKDFSNCFNYFYQEVQKEGYEAMLYSSKFYLEDIWINKNNYPVWLAHYTESTNYEGDYILWQLSNTGRVDGIDGNVDIDVYYKK